MFKIWANFFLGVKDAADVAYRPNIMHFMYIFMVHYIVLQF